MSLVQPGSHCLRAAMRCDAVAADFNRDALPDALVPNDVSCVLRRQARRFNRHTTPDALVSNDVL